MEELRPVLQAAPSRWPVPRAVVLFAGLALAFSLVHGQAPLFYSNQNQYLLHGLAWAGQGFLRDDWLAQTTDPTPVFSQLVCWTARLLPLEALHVWYGLMLGLYAFCLLQLFRWQSEYSASWRLSIGFLALLFLSHAALVRWLSYRWLGWDYPYYLLGGLAGQYVLGPVFQPSVFGVLLLASLVLFLKDRPRLAALVAGLGAIAHTTYLPSACFLITGYLAVLLRERRIALACRTAILFALLMLPVLAYIAVNFAPASAEEFAEAQRILAHERIPHHCQACLWFDVVAGAQVAWMLLGVALSWRTRLFPVLACCVVLGTALTAAQVLTGSDGLALLFPWRISVILVPVATALVIGRIVLAAKALLDNRAAAALAGLTILALALAGLWIMIARQAFQSSDEELPLLAWVREHKQRGDVYLLAIQVPKLAKTTRGSLSSDFKPVAAKRADSKIIPVDLQRFRLATGAPIYVDFKSVPYRAADVFEWRRRLQHNQEILDLLGSGPPEHALEELRRAGVTHIVLPAQASHVLGELPLVYADSAYQVRRVSPSASGN